MVLLGGLIKYYSKPLVIRKKVISEKFLPYTSLINHMFLTFFAIPRKTFF